MLFNSKGITMTTNDKELQAREDAYRELAGYSRRKLIVIDFLAKLVAQDEICDPQIFTILRHEADRLGYKLRVDMSANDWIIRLEPRE